jgi:DNA polymerase III subunit delta'
MQFKEVIGQESVKKQLARTVKENRVCHAQLFLGAEGSGNLALAIAYAQYLVCENPSEHDSCGMCPACIKMKKLSHSDVTFTYPVAPRDKINKPKSNDFAEDWRNALMENPYINFNDWVEQLDIENKQGIISAEECNDIIRRLSLKSFEHGYKIVIIWQPDKLFYSAAPKLLKIIEEPPDQTVFLLVAENYEQIISTITSRCQLVKLNLLSDAEIAQSLMKHNQLSMEDAKKIAHRADGSYREALLLANNNTTEEDAKLFLQWMRDCLKLKVKEIGDFVQSVADRPREKQKMFLRTSLQIVRECFLLNYGHHSMIRMEGEELESFKRFAPYINRNNAEQFAEELNKAHFHLERNANTKILFSDLSFTLNKLLSITR